MENKPVLYEKNNKIGQISFNRPDNLNSMNQETVSAFQETIDHVKNDRELRCLIVTGSGTTFCGGADFKSGFEKNAGPRLNEVLMDFYRPFLDIGNLKVPVIAAINELPRLVGLAKANELLFTGELITGEEAALTGLVNYAVDKDKVMGKAMALADEIAQSAPAAVQMM